jgi:hypothetical protein
MLLPRAVLLNCCLVCGYIATARVMCDCLKVVMGATRGGGTTDWANELQFHLVMTCLKGLCLLHLTTLW